jgi:large subunit ribosomal protein L4
MTTLDITVRDSTGAATASATLDAALFGIEPHIAVMHQVVTAQLAAARSGTQSTKTRAEVSGGGKKPFKQKGTGRARQGSERAPHFTGGGVALGPKPRSYRQRTPRKMIQLALRSALSDRAAEGRVAVVDSWPWDMPNTKSAIASIAALHIEGRVLVVLSRENDEAYRSFRNLPEIQVILAGELNAYDVLCNDWIVFTTETLPGETVYGTAADEPAPVAQAAPAPAATVVEADESAADVEAVGVEADDEVVEADDEVEEADEVDDEADDDLDDEDDDAADDDEETE